MTSGVGHAGYVGFCMSTIYCLGFWAVLVKTTIFKLYAVDVTLVNRRNFTGVRSLYGRLNPTLNL